MKNKCYGKSNPLGSKYLSPLRKVKKMPLTSLEPNGFSIFPVKELWVLSRLL